MDRRGRRHRPPAPNTPPHNHRRNSAMIKLQTIRQTLRMSPPAHLRPGSEPLLRSNSLSSPHIPSSRYRNILLSRYQNDVPAEFEPVSARSILRMSPRTSHSPETPRRAAPFRATARISARGLFGLN